MKYFDVIIVGGGHAGIEAAYASSKLGANTALITLDLHKIGHMPCNPAIGGVGKGHIVFELSAFGGLMPQLCTKTYLQARMLNTKKGPAVQGLRLQIDKHAYSQLSRKMLAHTENLTLIPGSVAHILFDTHNHVSGVMCEDKTSYGTRSVVLTTGTFLNGVVHIGNKQHSAGRQGEKAVTQLAQFLNSLKLNLGRLKTGTPPRILKASIDFSRMHYQKPDNLTYLFEFYPHTVFNSRACYITHTNKKTHDIIQKNLHRSAMYSGNIKGIGPRYCPSIEDKVGRFASKESHHVFVEPESVYSEEIYPNGISTSLPLDIQKEFLHSITGFENAVISKAGYAIEYDFIVPNQLQHTLELIKYPGLFLAGQINGTTGYEEAAGQGLIAGINAAYKAHNRDYFILSREDSYIGVMIDDLVTLGVDEPYRMFTSRAEYRLSLRQDNVFTRLAEKSYNAGLINEQLYEEIQKEARIVKETIKNLKFDNNTEHLLRLLGRDLSNIQLIKQYIQKPISDRALLSIWADIRYEPYLKREESEREKLQRYRELSIPKTFIYTDIPGLSKELQEKLTQLKPKNIAAASLISGMTPAAISLLIFKIKDHKKSK